MDLTTSILPLVGLMNFMPRSRCTEDVGMIRDASRMLLLLYEYNATSATTILK